MEVRSKRKRKRMCQEGRRTRERGEKENMQRRGEEKGGLLPGVLQPWQTVVFVSICPSLSLSHPPASLAIRQKDMFYRHTHTHTYIHTHTHTHTHTQYANRDILVSSIHVIDII